MTHEGIGKDTITYTAAISACEKGQQWTLALDLLRQMTHEGIGKNTITCSAAVSACDEGQQGALALDLLSEMTHEGIGKNTTPTLLPSVMREVAAVDLALDLLKTPMRHWQRYDYLHRRHQCMREGAAGALAA